MKRILILIMLLTAPLSSGALEFDKYMLDNGMEVVIVPDHRSPVVVNFIWFKAGAGDEVDGKTGLAHMLEHLMFKGTKNIPPQEFSKIIARNGGRDNAFTSYDYTAYFQKMAKDKLELAMEMEADRLTGLTFTDEQFLPERDVVAEERRWRIDSKPVNRFYEEMQGKHFDVSPYSRPVIGYMKDIQAYSREDNLAWYKKWYQPNNALLILVGDITLEEAKPLVAKTYGKVPSTKLIKRAQWPVEPVWNEAKRYEKVDSDVKVPLFERFYRTPSHFAGIAGADDGSEDALTLSLLSQVFGGGQTGLLYQHLVKDLKIADRASTSYSGVSIGESSFDITVQPKAGITLAQVESAVNAQVDKIIEEGFEKEDLERARVKFLSSAIYAQDDPFTSAYLLGRWILSGGTAETYDDWQSDIKKITVQDLQRVAQKYLIENKSTTGLLVNDKSQF